MKKDIKPIQNIPTKSSIKYVKKARQWVKTEWINGKQTLTWSTDRPNGNY